MVLLKEQLVCGRAEKEVGLWWCWESSQFVAVLGSNQFLAVLSEQSFCRRNNC